MGFRETGSIVVNAPRERVFDVLHERLLATDPGLHSVAAQRIESRLRTFVLQDAPHGTGTRIVLGRTAPTLRARRDELRRDVASELLALQKLVE